MFAELRGETINREEFKKLTLNENIIKITKTSYLDLNEDSYRIYRKDGTSFRVNVKKNI